MNEQQLAAVKQALEALESFDGVGDVVTWEKQWKLCIKAHESLQSIISQDALDKKAENARELGLNYDTPLSSFVRSSDEAKAEVMERVIDKATEEQKAVIGCDKCKAVQEPVLKDNSNYRLDPPGLDQLYTTPPAAQSVPVKTYHDGKPWPVAPKPWVGLTDEDISAAYEQMPDYEMYDEFARAIEQRLKDKNT
jgi:hypothetical protein